MKPIDTGTGRLYHVTAPDTAEVVARIRPPVLPMRVDLAVEGFTLINWAVPPERLAAVLLPGLVPTVMVVGRHRVAWLSIALGRVVTRAIGGLPVPPIAFHQLNYRTYVEGPHGHRLWIFRSVIGPRPAAVAARIAPGFPARAKAFQFTPRIAGGRLLGVEAEVGAAGAELDLAVEALDDAPWTPGFATPEAAVDLLGNVPEALYALGDDRLGLMVANHPPLRPEAGRLVRARLGWLVDQGLLLRSEVAYPASVFLQAEVALPTHM